MPAIRIDATPTADEPGPPAIPVVLQYQAPEPDPGPPDGPLARFVYAAAYGAGRLIRPMSLADAGVPRRGVGRNGQPVRWAVLPVPADAADPNAAAAFRVSADGRPVGTLTVGTAGVGWTPVSKRGSRTVRWRRFVRWMLEQ